MSWQAFHFEVLVEEATRRCSIGIVKMDKEEAPLSNYKSKQSKEFLFDFARSAKVQNYKGTLAIHLLNMAKPSSGLYSVARMRKEINFSDKIDDSS
ncbi:hypothetical protein CR513_40151, partial [Mucuna pruriens]